MLFNFSSAVLVLLLLVVSVATATVSELDYQLAYAKYLREHQKVHLASEFATRYQLFKSHLQWVEEHNKDASHTYTVGLNQFSDLKLSEQQAYSTGYQSSQQERDLTEQIAYGASPVLAVGAPRAVDWRTKNVVVPVKDQGNCNSCYIFTGTNLVETQHAIATGTAPTVLSEQYLLDCSSLNGCNSGFPADTISWISKNGHCPQSGYKQYTASKGTCTQCQTNAPKVFAGAFTRVAANRESTDMKTAVYRGPLVVAVHSGDCFRSYTGGILNDPKCCDKPADHVVIVDGYGHDDKSNQDYWIVRNSWSAKYGENGYIRLAIGKNMCQIGSEYIGYTADQADSARKITYDTAKANGGQNNNNNNNNNNNRNNNNNGQFNWNNGQQNNNNGQNNWNNGQNNNVNRACRDQMVGNMCKEWAINGLCRQQYSQDMMRASCASTCGFCNNVQSTGADSGGGASGGCQDLAPTAQCAQSASSGECTSNRDWMLINCRNTCKQCNSWVQLAPGVQSGTDDESFSRVCVDSDAQMCPTWAAKGDCNSNPAYMLAYCAKSCNVCPMEPNNQLAVAIASARTQLGAGEQTDSSSSSPLAMIAGVAAAAVVLAALTAVGIVMWRRRKANSSMRLPSPHSRNVELTAAHVSTQPRSPEHTHAGRAQSPSQSGRMTSLSTSHSHHHQTSPVPAL